MIALRSLTTGAFAAQTGRRASILTAVALNPAKLAAVVDGLLALATFGVAGNIVWDCRDQALGRFVFWLSLTGLAAARMLAALFGLFGADRLVRTEDGLFRERTLFGVGTRVAVE
jgi:hypothetical protein